MVLFGVFGDIGSGKTATAVYITWKRWFYYNHRVFSNISLFLIPYFKIKSIGQFGMMEQGYCLLDELWNFADCRLSGNKKNILIADVARRSRKKHTTYLYTAQDEDSPDKRIRKNTQFSAWPVFSNATNIYCRAHVFKRLKKKKEYYLYTIRYETPLVFMLYNTDEDTEMDDDIDNKEPFEIIFQPSIHDDKIKFKTWEEADKYAREYWVKNSGLIKKRIMKMTEKLLSEENINNPYARFYV